MGKTVKERRRGKAYLFSLSLSFLSLCSDKYLSARGESSRVYAKPTRADMKNGNLTPENRLGYTLMQHRERG